MKEMLAANDIALIEQSAKQTMTTAVAAATTTTTTIASQAILKPILAGALTGAIESFVTYPTEYIKTHLQLQDQRNPKYRGISDCFVKTVREHGPGGLYRGMAPILAGSIPKQASRWGAYEAAVSTVHRAKYGLDSPAQSSSSTLSAQLNLLEISCCGFFAGSVEAIFAVVPTETVKTKLIDDAKSSRPRFGNKNLLASVSMMVREEGFRGAYAGVSNTVTKQGLNQSIRFPVQMTTMSFLCGSEHKYRKKSPLWNGFAGFVAGIVSVVVTQPFDVVKTKMQGREAKRYRGSVDCWRTIAREQGLAHFYSGSLA